jgi:hypothetical protein
MANSAKAFAGLINRMSQRAVGVDSARLQKFTTQADIDTITENLKLGTPVAKYRTGGYYGGAGSIDTLTLTEDVMVLGPIMLESFMVVEEIGVDVTTAGTEGDLYVALYRDRGDGYPGAVIHESAALAVTTGFKSTTGLAIPLTPGLYWAGALCNQVTTTVATVRSLINNSPYVGETAGANDVNAAGYSEASLTATPPANFTATATVVAEVPRVLLKCKSS